MPENWTMWQFVSLIDELKELYKWNGVYALRLVDSNDKPIEIGRFLKENKSGIIQIGRSKNLGNRLSQFYKAYLGERHLHSEGSRLFLIRVVTRFEREVYKNAAIQFSVKRYTSEEEAKYEEERLLKCYFLEFGELPPLNYQIEDFRFKWTSPDCDNIDLW